MQYVSFIHPSTSIRILPIQGTRAGGAGASGAGATGGAGLGGGAVALVI